MCVRTSSNKTNSLSLVYQSLIYPLPLSHNMNTYCSLFWLISTFTVLLPQISLKHQMWLHSQAQTNALFPTLLFSLTWHCWEDHTAAPSSHQGYQCLWPWRLCTPRSRCDIHRKMLQRSWNSNDVEPFLYCPCSRIQPFQGSKVCKDLVAFIFHLAVDAVDGDLLDESLQSSTVVLHTGTRAERESSHHSSYKLMTHHPLLP